MPIGLNVKARVWRMLNQPSADDDVGGAMITGSMAYGCINMRWTPRASNLTLLEQGLETKELQRVMAWPASLLVYERDELEITAPSNHPNYGERWRVISANRQGIHPSDPRGFLHLTIERIERSRAVQ